MAIEEMQGMMVKQSSSLGVHLHCLVCYVDRDVRLGLQCATPSVQMPNGCKGIFSEACYMLCDKS